MAEWIDASSYSRGERGNTAPTVWELQGTKGVLRLVVHRHIYAPDRWHVSCHEAGVDKVDVGDDLEAAKDEAVRLVERRLSSPRRPPMTYVASPNPVSRERQLVSQWLRVPKYERGAILDYLRSQEEWLSHHSWDAAKAYRAAIALLEWERE